jgi:hypothetical protein
LPKWIRTTTRCVSLAAIFSIYVSLAIAADGKGSVSGVKDFFMEPDHIILIMLSILIALTVGGKNLAEFIKGLIRKSGDVTVNNLPENRNGVEKCPVIAAGGVPINPELCTAHKAENERSLRNEKAISKVDENLHATRAALFKKLETIEAGVTEIKVCLAGLTVKTNMNDRDARKRGGEE